MKKQVARVQKITAAVQAAREEIAEAALARRELQDAEAATRLGNGPTASELKKLRATVQKGADAEEALPGLQRELEDAAEDWREAEIERLNGEVAKQRNERHRIEGEIERIKGDLDEQIAALKRHRMQPNAGSIRVRVGRMTTEQLVTEAMKHAN